MEVGMAAAVVAATIGWLLGRGARLLLRRLPRPVRCDCRVGDLVVGASWAAVFVACWFFGAPWRWAPLWALLALYVVLLCGTDLVALRLPDVLTLSAYPVLGGAAVFAEPSAWVRILLAAALLSAVHALAYLAGTGLGFGDVKLVGALGFVLGARGWLPVFALVPLSSLCTLVLAARAPPGHRLRAAVPHGPGLLLSTAVLTLW